MNYIKSYNLEEKDFCNKIFYFSTIFNKYVPNTIAPIYSYYIEYGKVYLEQQYIEYPLIITEDNLKKVAALLARIHNGFNKKEIREACFQEWDVNIMLNKLLDNNKVRGDVKEVYEKIQLIIDKFSRESFSCLIHGDFKSDNIRYNGKECIAIDLDTMGMGESFIDIGRIVVDLLRYNKKELVIPFLNEYSSIMGLDKCSYNGAIEVSLWAKILWLKTKIVYCSSPWEKRLSHTLLELYNLTEDRQLKVLLNKLF